LSLCVHRYDGDQQNSNDFLQGDALLHLGIVFRFIGQAGQYIPNPREPLHGECGFWG